MLNSRKPRNPKFGTWNKNKHRLVSILLILIFAWLLFSAAAYGAWHFWINHCSDLFQVFCEWIDTSDQFTWVIFIIVIFAIGAIIEILTRKRIRG